jgi:cytochrome c oxidase assembly factor 5
MNSKKYVFDLSLLIKKCLQDTELAHLVPDKCFVLANTFFECKRSLIDMRRRFRGAKGY